MLSKVKDAKPKQVKEMQQIYTLQQLKQIKHMQDLVKELRMKEDIQWQKLEEINDKVEERRRMLMEKSKVKGAFQ